MSSNSASHRSDVDVTPSRAGSWAYDRPICIPPTSASAKASPYGWGRDPKVTTEGAATAAAVNSLNGLATNAQGAAAKVSDLDNELDSVGKRGQGLESLKDAFQALASAVVVSAFIDANLEAEKFDKAMTSLQGSSAAAAQSFCSSLNQVPLSP